MPDAQNRPASIDYEVQICRKIADNPEANWDQRRYALPYLAVHDAEWHAAWRQRQVAAPIVTESAA